MNSPNAGNSTQINNTSTQTVAENLPTKAKVAEKIKMPDSKEMCEAGAEIASNKQMIHACYTAGQISTQCQQLFDNNGNYSGGFNSYVNDIIICLNQCHLPNDVISRSNDALAVQKEGCKYLYSYNSREYCQINPSQEDKKICDIFRTQASLDNK